MNKEQQTPKDYIIQVVKNGIEKYKDDVDAYVEFAEAMKSTEYITDELLDTTTLSMMTKATQEKNWNDAHKLKSLGLLGNSNIILHKFDQVKSEILLHDLLEIKNPEEKADALMKKMQRYYNKGIKKNQGTINYIMGQLHVISGQLKEINPEKEIDIHLARLTMANEYYHKEDGEVFPFSHHAESAVAVLKERAEECYEEDPKKSMAILAQTVNALVSVSRVPDYLESAKKSAHLIAKASIDFAHRALDIDPVIDRTFFDYQFQIEQQTRLYRLTGEALSKATTKIPTDKDNELKESELIYRKARFLKHVEENGFEKGFEKTFREKLNGKFVFGALGYTTEEWQPIRNGKKRKRAKFIKEMKKQVDSFYATYPMDGFIPKKTHTNRNQLKINI